MDFQPEYWHWMVLGAALILSEIFLASFTVLWFGLGAITVGLIMLLLPDLSLGAQILIWAVGSVGFTIAWFKVLKPRMIDKTPAGISREAALGETGQVIKAPIADVRGVVRFTLPVMGDDEWEFICEQNVRLGDKVSIIDFSGNTLVVTLVG